MRLLAIALVMTLAAPATAEPEPKVDPGGTLNPDEMSLDRMRANIAEGRTDMTTCAAGYMMTKSGQHGMARDTFTACAEAGYTGAMTWMGQLENNGLGAPENPDAAAEWDRRAAEAGDPIGKFNYGLDKLRGRGTALDRDGGRRLIDEAAEAGLEIAQRLRGADYDMDEVTPDADNWKYAPLF
ncbi:hypothetical protein LCGC14_0631820 [marine sediment metagenome]|uniref:Sel1 repeat family protein n=1 Tax=marine sediment metagenome TaxID=412755 RepID=A0A0F9R6Z2_9ZZZZ